MLHSGMLQSYQQILDKVKKIYKGKTSRFSPTVGDEEKKSFLRLKPGNQDLCLLCASHWT
jgi:hypothetical protein